MTAKARTTPTNSRAAQCPTLTEALQVVERGLWRGLRTLSRNISQAHTSICILNGLGVQRADQVTPEILTKFQEISLRRCSPATLRVRLSALRALGVNIPKDAGPKHRAPRKWFLKPEDEARLAECPGLLPITRHFILWTVATGLRVEESLRLRWSDISLAEGLMAVPGTKTDGSAATLPLSEEARGVLARHVSWDALVFPIPYKLLRAQWEVAREFLGYRDVPTATLKALRRSFARRAHLKGMPADVLRQYLRHGSIKTTLGYLHLVGGYSQDEMRRWL